jgi:hypothetical protein
MVVDPLSSLLAALVAGAAGALKTTAAAAVKDGYSALKRMLLERHKAVDITAIERDPKAPKTRRGLERQLRKSGAGEDAELVAAAKVLLQHVAREDPKLAEVIGVDIEGIRAGTVRISDIISAGGGVRVRNAVAKGDFRISGVRAGAGTGETLGKR